MPSETPSGQSELRAMVRRSSFSREPTLGLGTQLTAFPKTPKRATAAKNKLDVRFSEEHPRHYVPPSPDLAGILALLRSDGCIGRLGLCGMGTG